MKQQSQIERSLVKTENAIRRIKLEKIVLSCGSTGPNIEKSRKLLEVLTNKKPRIVKAGPKRRIPAFGVKPGLELGVMVTIRGKEAFALLKKLLGAVDNTLDASQISENTFSFGIPEYIEIHEVEYIREIGIRGLNVTVSFIRAGVRVKRKKIKRGRLPKKQNVTADEIISLMEENFNSEVEE